MPISYHITHYDLDETNRTNQGPILPVGLSFDLDLGTSSQVTYGVSLEDKRYVFPDWVSPYGTDFKLKIDDGGIHYDNKTLIEGVITGHSIEAESGLSSITGLDYYHLFETRAMPVDPTFPRPYIYTHEWFDKSPTQILTDIITYIFGLDNSQFTPTLNFGDDSASTQTYYNIPLGDASFVNTIIENFAKAYPGFDFRMTAPRTLNIWPIEFDPVHLPVYIFEERDDGSLPGVTAGPNWNNPGPAATHAYGTGAGIGTQFAQNYEYVPSSERYRRIDSTPNFGDIVNRKQIRLATAGALGIGLDPAYEVAMTVDTDRCDTPRGFFNDFVPGCYIFIRKNLIGHLLDGLFKVIQISCTVDSTGKCLATLKCNRETNTSLTFSAVNP